MTGRSKGEIDPEAVAWNAAAGRVGAGLRAQEEATRRRGKVREYHFEPVAAPKPAVVVSNNGRNRSVWPLVHVVSVTTAAEEPRPTIVEILEGEPVGGRVVCDDPAPVAEVTLGRRLGGLYPQVVQCADAALKIVVDVR